jgi:hypothetical protein
VPYGLRWCWTSTRRCCGHVDGVFVPVAGSGRLRCNLVAVYLLATPARWSLGVVGAWGGGDRSHWRTSCARCWWADTKTAGRGAGVHAMAYTFGLER